MLPSLGSTAQLWRTAQRESVGANLFASTLFSSSSCCSQHLATLSAIVLYPFCMVLCREVLISTFSVLSACPSIHQLDVIFISSTGIRLAKSTRFPGRLPVFLPLSACIAQYLIVALTVVFASGSLRD